MSPVQRRWRRFSGPSISESECRLLSYSASSEARRSSNGGFAAAGGWDVAGASVVCVLPSRMERARVGLFRSTGSFKSSRGGAKSVIAWRGIGEEPPNLLFGDGGGTGSDASDALPRLEKWRTGGDS